MALPRISIVTPSFNQGRFLGETLRSIHAQNYPDLEHVVMDGGSTDNSADVIREYESKLTHWVSEKDGGQYDAVNRGFAKTTGEVMAWLNSDDMYTPWALAVVGEVFEQLPEVQWITTLFPLHWDAQGRAIKCKQVKGYSSRGFYKGENVPRPGALTTDFIQQESTFWRRSLWEKAGGAIDAALPLAGDQDLWAKFFRHADLYGVAIPLGGFRVHGDQKTGQRMDAYLREAMEVIARHGGAPYQPWQAAVRSGGSRFLPGRVKRLVGLADPIKVITHRDGRWITSTRY